MKFSKYLLGDLVKIQSSKRVYHKDYVEEGIPFYRSKEIIEKSKNKEVSTSLFILEEHYNELESSNGAPKEGDMLLTSVGTIGVPYLVTEEDRFYFKDGNLTWFSNFSEYLNNKYLFHWIRSSIGRNKIDSIVIGSTQKALTMVQLKKIEIEVPEIGYQNRVVTILDSIENKIVMNYKMIDTLEEMASTLFKRWFVDFEFPDENGNPYKSSGGKMIDSELGEIPEGWKVCCISEIIEKSTKKIEIDQLSLKNYVSTENLLPNKKGLTDAAKLPTQIKVNKFEENDILISNIRPYFKKIWYSDRIGGYSNDVLNFKSNKTVSSEYLYLFLKDDSFFNFMVATSKGTKMPRGDKTAIQNKELVIPCKSIDESFKAKIVNLLRKIKILDSQNTELGMLRDTLLPKLLTGEIEV